MRSKDIKAGRTYRNATGFTKRHVLGIGLEHRPGTALTTGVWYDESQQRTTLVGGQIVLDEVVVRDQRAYLDTFATWAKAEVKP